MRYLSCDGIWIFLWNNSKSHISIFGAFLVLKSTTWSLEMPHLFLFENFEMPHSYHLISKIEKWGIPKDHWKWDILRKSTWLRFWNKKNTKMKSIDFWGISKKNANTVTWYLIHRFLWAFHSTFLPVLVERVEFESLKKRIDKSKSIENI